MLSYYNQYLKVVGGFKKDPEDDQGETCGAVEELDVEKNVWKVAPSLTVPKEFLRTVQVKNFYK